MGKLGNVRKWVSFDLSEKKIHRHRQKYVLSAGRLEGARIVEELHGSLGETRRHTLANPTMSNEAIQRKPMILL